MANENVGPSAPIVSVRPGRNRLTEEDRLLQAAKRERKQKHQYGEPGEPDQDSLSQDGAAGHGAFDDDVSILGIPKEEMTPNVRQAIQTLLDEINTLRGELSRAKGHEAYLEEQAEKDRVLHVMRRRAFVARMALAVRRVDEEDVPFSFLYIQIANAPDIRAAFGVGAEESLMQQAADALREGAETGDVLGSLESHDFGVILPGDTLDAAENKAQSLMASMSGRSFSWQGEMLHVHARFGDTLIGKADSAEEIIQRAKDNMMARG
ncbi:GGDEF domain-containing protein [Magnetovibrio sp. PR-2]|uniref:GGDEF domain-containing protein n=1 Tax=Magnetovibrio sp. PR-2 TaxID=3120356 RepID=UPI002FCE5CFD